MPGAEFLKNYRGVAGGWSDVERLAFLGPLELVSHPIYAPRFGQPELSLKPYEIPVLESDEKRDGADFSSMPAAMFEVRVPDTLVNEAEQHDWQERAFRTLLAKKDCFAIGGTKLITEFGILPAWLRESAQRDVAKALILERSWAPFLRVLKGKEHEDDDDYSLIGQKDISDYFSALPAPNRDTDNGKPVGRKSKKQKKLNGRDRRNRLSLRLRKAIEIIVLLEAVLDERFSRPKPQSTGRFAKISGKSEQEASASYVWDHLWIEPVIYVVTPRPRPIDVERIVLAEQAGGLFQAECGQKPEILYRILFGAPCTWNTCVAAAAACNRFYGVPNNGETPNEGPMPSIPATIRPNEFDERKKIINQVNFRTDGCGIPKRYQDAYEDLILPGIIAPASRKSERAAKRQRS